MSERTQRAVADVETEPCNPQSGGALLAVGRLSVTYRRGSREIAALRGVSLSLVPGEVVALIGPNGSGKSTLIRAVTGGVKRDAGRVELLGDDIDSLSAMERARRVAVVPQTPVLPGAFTVLELVLMGRTPHLRFLEQEGERDLEITRRAMEATGTRGLADRPVGELSGGERQGVVLARALAQETPLLLLDEPTAHLDIGHQASVLSLVRRLCLDEGMGALAVVHDLTLAAAYCDRLVLLHEGHVVAEGTAQTTLRREVLERVYGTRVNVFPHPETGLPVVAPGFGSGVD
jgi:iron complex transport system ATP-binding protein